MKRILLSLLACSIGLSAFAQIDTSGKINPGNSDKWEIIKGNVKAVKSKLFVSLPADSHWDMTIYAAGSTKVLSNTLLKKEILLLPGSYDVEINKIRINGVPVEKGKNTRLKAGVLHITTMGGWTLTDENLQTVLINTYDPQSRGLPIGKYKLIMRGLAHDVEIKDGRTSVDIPSQPETDKWDITPSESLPDGMGRLTIKLPGPQRITLPTGESVVIPDATKCRVVIDATTSIDSDTINMPINLAPGTYYKIYLNKVSIDNVPIQEGKETRLKAGFLLITLDDYDGAYWNLYRNNELGLQQLFEFQHQPGKYALPPGEYLLSKNFPSQVRYKVIIKDGETVKNGEKL